MYGLDVLQCIVHGGFGLYFVGFVVLGGVLSFFLPKDCCAIIGLNQRDLENQGNLA